MNIAKRREAGFTLLEIIVTVALTAIVVTMGFSVMVSAQQIAQQQQEQSAAGRDGWTFVYKLSRELREAVPPSQLGEGAEWRGTSSPAKKLLDVVSTANWTNASINGVKECPADQAPVFSDTIRFCTLRAASPNQRPVPGMIEYSLKRDEKKNVINIERRSAPMGVSLDKGEKEVMSQVIAPSDPGTSLGFVSLRFQYLDAQGQWHAEWTDTKAMPRAVRVSVGTFVRPSRQMKVPVVNGYSTLVYLPTDSRIPQ